MNFRLSRCIYFHLFAYLEAQNKNLELKLRWAAEERLQNEERRAEILTKKTTIQKRPSSTVMPEPAAKVQAQQFNASEITDSFIMEQSLQLQPDTKAVTTFKTTYSGILNENKFLRRLDSNANGTLSGIRQFLASLAQLPPQLKQSGGMVWIKFNSDLEQHKNIMEDVKNFNNDKTLSENLNQIHEILVTLYDICRPSSNISTLSRIILWTKLDSVAKVVGSEKLKMVTFNMTEHQKSGAMKALFLAESSKLSVWKQLKDIRSDTRNSGYNEFRQKDYYKESKSRGSRGGRGGRGGRGARGGRGSGRGGYSGDKSDYRGFKNEKKRKKFCFPNFSIH